MTPYPTLYVQNRESKTRNLFTWSVQNRTGSLERSTGCPRDQPVVLSKTGIDIGFGWKRYLNGPKWHVHFNQVEFEFPLRCAFPLFSSSSSQGCGVVWYVWLELHVMCCFAWSVWVWSGSVWVWSVWSVWVWSGLCVIVCNGTERWRQAAHQFSN